MKANIFYYHFDYISIGLFCRHIDLSISNFDEESLGQTSWNGTLIVGENTSSPLEATVSLAFYTDSRGEYDLKYQNEDHYNYSIIEYSLDNKLLTIKKNTLISGYWLVVRRTKTEMVLENGSDANPDLKKTIRLERAD